MFLTAATANKVINVIREGGYPLNAPCGLIDWFIMQIEIPEERTFDLPKRERSNFIQKADFSELQIIWSLSFS